MCSVDEPVLTHEDRLTRLVEAVAMNSMLRVHTQLDPLPDGQPISEDDYLMFMTSAMETLQRVHHLYQLLERELIHPEVFFGLKTKHRVDVLVARIDEALKARSLRG